MLEISMVNYVNDGLGERESEKNKVENLKFEIIQVCNFHLKEEDEKKKRSSLKNYRDCVRYSRLSWFKPRGPKKKEKKKLAEVRATVGSRRMWQYVIEIIFIREMKNNVMRRMGFPGRRKRKTLNAVSRPLYYVYYGLTRLRFFIRLMCNCRSVGQTQQQRAD